MDKALEDILSIPPEELGRGSPIKVEILDTEDDTYHDFARVMAYRIQENNARGEITAFILPVGPIGQYRRLARICNLEGISCQNLVAINMDEYCNDNGSLFPYEHPLSFRRFMDEEFFFLLDEDKTVLAENRVFPDPENPGLIMEKIDDVGGVDICFGGIGIMGHVAFNEPPEPGEEVDPEAFRNSTTRVLALTRETRLINSVTAGRGNVDAVPRLAITVGMREILESREVHIYMNRHWQSAIVRKFIHGPITPRCPASFLQTHPNCTVTMTSYVAQLPALRLR
jgi:glucosamine-6-phosphate deaminase